MPLSRVTRQALQVLAVVAALILLAPTLYWHSRPTLKVYIWGAYLPPLVLTEFELTHHVRLDVHTYMSNEELLAHLKVSWGEYDVIMPSNYIVQEMREYNLLRRLDLAAVPNLANLSPESLHGHVVAEGDEYYGVPYLHNYAGIGYSKKQVGAPPLTWATFFSEASARRFGPSLSLLNEPRETIGLALVSLGYSPNTRDPKQLEQVRQLLVTQAQVGRPTRVLENGRDLLESGATSLLATWSPEIALAESEDSDIGYVMPSDGSILTADALAIPRSSNQQELAMEFINYLLRPDVARKVTEYSGYANSLQDSMQHIADVSKNSPAFAVPPPGKSFVLTDVGDEQYLYDTIWAEYTSTLEGPRAP